MSSSYRLTPLAIADLVDISEYVEAKFGIDVADRTLERIIETLELLATDPDIGHSRPDLVAPP